MNPARQAALVQLLERLEPRRPLLQERCQASLVAEHGLPETLALALTGRWSKLLVSLRVPGEFEWRERARQFGAWCAAEQIPFEAVAAYLPAFKRAATPPLVREYPGVEGYLDALLLLDEALTMLMGWIPAGYYGRLLNDK
jgi:hypothetical protein